VRIRPFAMLLCLLPGCVDYTGGLCIPHADTFCTQGKTYWLDSCKRVENVLEECECGCRADQYGCRACGEQECQADADCPEGFFCDRTDWRCKLLNCVPQCAGKCCGPDGCGGNCPSSCPDAQECNPATCRCESHCYTDADCAASRCCLRGQCVVMACGTLECGPDPVCGKECGPCPRGTHCDMGTCVGDVACTSDVHCAANQCCINGTCVAMACGTLQCGPDPVCGRECGPCHPGWSCQNGRCVQHGGFCPPGQECVDLNGAGYLGCIIPPATIPGDNQTGCNVASGTPCYGNYTCHCLDQSCSDSVCIENCGTCPAGTDCCELWTDGPSGCLASGCYDLPPNPPYCDQNVPCQGNSQCYTDGTNNFCIDSCSAYSDVTCVEGEARCQGTVLQVCVNGAWTAATDCAFSNQVCYGGACVLPAGLGEFCDALPCAAGLDCLATPQSQHSFCTGPCDCLQGSGCDAGWSCILQSEPVDPTQCWCGKPCQVSSDCPNGGAGWICGLVAHDEQGNAVYGCLPL
jgi:hypothetical protein